MAVRQSTTDVVEEAERLAQELRDLIAAIREVIQTDTERGWSRE
jgi:hypothetical protein